MNKRIKKNSQDNIENENNDENKLFDKKEKEKNNKDQIKEKELKVKKNGEFDNLNNNIDNEKDLKENKIESINNRSEKGIDVLIKKKLDLMHNAKKNKFKNLFINSNLEHHSSNFKLNTFNNEFLLYKNKCMKNISLADKILKDNKKEKGIILPNIKTPIKKEKPYLYSNNSNFYHFTKIPKESLANIINNNPNNEQKNEIISDKMSLFRNIKLNRIININNNDTQTTQSATNSIKAQNSSKNNIVSNINEDINKYEMGLIPAGSTENNNIIIPMLAMKSTIDNFNGNNENNKNEKSEIKKGLFNFNLSRNSRNRIFKSNELKGKINISMKNKELCYFFSDVQKFFPNFHKIKIEKRIDNNNLMNSYSKKISFDYKSKNNINFYDNNLNVKSLDN